MGVEKLPVRLSFEDLRAYTDDFSEQNCIGEFQFGKVYHGKIHLQGWANPKFVTVKIWEVPTKYGYFEGENTNRLMDEVVFLQQPKIAHPVLMKLYGYCCEADQCGIVYDFKSFDTVSNLISCDDFKWWQRIKVALRFAHFLRFLHAQTQGEKPLIIRNIDAAHIMVDEDWNPKLYDFSMVIGCIFPDRTLYRVQHVHGSYGYMEPLDCWSQKSDVYGYGVVLLCMMTKELHTDEERLNGKPCVGERCYDKYIERGEKTKMSLVRNSFRADQSFCASDGPKITRLAISCVRLMFDDRPEMKQVVDGLQKLKVVRRYLNAYIEK